MSLDKDLKEAFVKHAEDVRPDAGSWNAVETKVRRAHHARVVAVSTFTVALIAAAAIVIPRLGKHTTSPGFTNPSAPKTTQTTTAAGQLVGTTYVGAPEGFSIIVPKTWHSSWFEGSYEIQPPGVGSLEKGGNTFAVTAHLDSGTYESFIPGDGSLVTHSEINGHPAVRVVRPGTTGSHEIDYYVKWDACYGGPCGQPGENTIRVTLFGSTRDLFNKYLSTGEKVAHSLDAYDGSTPAHGAMPGFTSDEMSNALVRFLDARVQGFDAELLMSQNAQSQYDGNELSLYTAGQSHWTTYTVIGRNGDARSTFATFLVRLYFGGTNQWVMESIQVSREHGLNQASPPYPIVDAATFEGSMTPQP